MELVRTEEEIADLMCRSYEAMIEGGRHPQMTYEQGIVAAVRWLTEPDDDDDPMDDDEGK